MENAGNPVVRETATEQKKEKQVVFTPEQMEEANRIAEERAQRASGAALKSYFQQQGMSEEEAKTALAAYKAQKASEKTPEQLAQEAKRDAADRIAAAKKALTQASARAAAVQLGVKPERVEYALKLADLSGVEIGDDMAVHQQSVYAAVKTVLDAIPELGSAIPATPAANPSNNTVSTGKDNPWSQEGFNLTEQGRILRSDPKLAAKLKAAAGIKT